MTTSDSTNFQLDVADYIEEAFERCGRTVRTGYDMKTAKRSLNLLLAEWANRGLNQWTIKQTSITTAVGIRVYPGGTLTMTVGASTGFAVSETITGSVSGATCSITNIPSATSFAITIPVGLFTTADTLTGGSSGATTTLSAAVDYLTIPNKSTTGRVDQFFLNRLITPELKLWPVPDNNTDVVVFNRLTRIQDADTFTNTFEVPFRFYPCLAAGLAYYLSLKIAPDRTALLKPLYEEEFDRAAVEDRDRASFTIQPGIGYSRFN